MQEINATNIAMSVREPTHLLILERDKNDCGTGTHTYLYAYAETKTIMPIGVLYVYMNDNAQNYFSVHVF